MQSLAIFRLTIPAGCLIIVAGGMMNTNTVEIKLNIDETVLLSMNSSKDEFKKILLFYTAYSLYRKGKLSLGKAAQLANYNRMDFIKKIQEEDEWVFDYDKEMIDKLIEKANPGN
jgi:predicted HTH domain antitoxin